MKTKTTIEIWMCIQEKCQWEMVKQIFSRVYLQLVFKFINTIRNTYVYLVLLRIQFCFVSFKDRNVRCVVWCGGGYIKIYIYIHTKANTKIIYSFDFKRSIKLFKWAKRWQKRQYKKEKGKISEEREREEKRER